VGWLSKNIFKNYFGVTDFNPPRSVTNPRTHEPVNILCECREIPRYLWIDIGQMEGSTGRTRRLNPIAKDILNGNIKPACWQHINDDKYSIKYNFKAFYDYAKDPHGGAKIMLSLGAATYNNTATGQLGPIGFAVGPLFSLFGTKRGGHRKRAPSSSRRLRRPTTVRSQALNSRRRRHTR